MEIVVRAWQSTGYKCRYCKEKCRWRITRPDRYSDDYLCDKHMGLSLRNLGLTRLSIVHEAKVAAVVRP